MADVIEEWGYTVEVADSLKTGWAAASKLVPDCAIVDLKLPDGSGIDLLKRFKEMKGMMKQLNKMGLASQFGAKGKRAALEGMSPDGEMATGDGGGLLGGIGSGLSGIGSGIGSGLSGIGRGIGGMFGGGGPKAPGGGMPGDMGGLFNGPRPMGSSATRQSGSKRKDKKKKDKKKRR